MPTSRVDSSSRAYLLKTHILVSLPRSRSTASMLRGAVTDPRHALKRNSAAFRSRTLSTNHWHARPVRPTSQPCRSPVHGCREWARVKAGTLRENGTMTQVVMVCGPAGSGKSAHARRLTTNGYTLLSFDAIAWELGHREHPLLDEARLAVHRVLQERLASLLKRDEFVVIDSSFWSRASRDTYRQFLAHRGVEPVVHYISTPREVILDRLAKRTNSGPDDIVVPGTRAQAYMDGFEVPQASEGPVVWVDGS